VIARYNEITGLLQQQRIAEALDLARSIVAADPNQREAREMAANFSARLNRLESADQAFTEPSSETSLTRTVVLQAGTYFLNRRDFEKARQCFQRLVFEDPEDVESLTLLAKTTVEMSDPAEARRLFEQALAIDPVFREATLVSPCSSIARAPRSGSTLRNRSLEVCFRPQANFDYGVFLLRHGREPEALERSGGQPTFNRRSLRHRPDGARHIPRAAGSLTRLVPACKSWCSGPAARTPCGRPRPDSQLEEK
jgi:tetratricopeptide (TPR) repeat protein